MNTFDYFKKRRKLERRMWLLREAKKIEAKAKAQMHELKTRALVEGWTPALFAVQVVGISASAAIQIKSLSGLEGRRKFARGGVVTHGEQFVNIGGKRIEVKSFTFNESR